MSKALAALVVANEELGFPPAEAFTLALAQLLIASETELQLLGM
jgi:hypothetical protein